MTRRIATLMTPTLLLTLVLSGPAMGQSPLDQYRAESYQLSMGFLSGPTLMRAGAEADLGFFGENGEALFAGSPAALDSIDSYQTMKTVGFVFWAVGLTTLTAMLVLIIVDDSVFIEPRATGDEIKPLFWGLLIGGGVTGMTGGMLMNGANGHLSDAVDHYNDDLYGRLGGSAGFSPKLTVTTKF